MVPNPASKALSIMKKNTKILIFRNVTYLKTMTLRKTAA